MTAPLAGTAKWREAGENDLTNTIHSIIYLDTFHLVSENNIFCFFKVV